jgi:MoxR-like ATPase
MQIKGNFPATPGFESGINRPGIMNEISPTLVRDLHARISQEIGKVVVGQDHIVRLLLVSLFSRGHCLLIGVPGLAKTLLVKTLSDVLHLSFKRIQFTPDLMPADIIGSELLQERDRRLEFEYQAGPIFANLLLADEINRTPPKTQSALLEAMQERKVTVGGTSRPLPDPFLVVATQNPIEQEGTYPLPEAQLDRFMFSLYLDYPDKNDEIEIVRRTTLQEMPTLTATVTVEEILQVQKLVIAAPVSDHVIDYAVELVMATRPSSPTPLQSTKDFVEWGAGPRASQYLILGAKALALLKGKLTPETEDVREVAFPVLQHRVITNYRATGAGKRSGDVIESILNTVKEKAY